ncbi:dihydrofolate reductase [Lederbergia graminis]|uniref:Dihydrofolate reductase n=1 Tax=Lederbergia graminis TaxID=735518 RepID=A0ABW0LDB2_9BACI|nr:dihydrofolate reductase [Paenibacillus bovis]HLU21377.1 dihydrofolate reductase [Bacillaceae bacterium]
MISFLWAEDENHLIGRNNDLPWRIPADLKYFKETTLGHPIVMGRKTYESIGKALPGRTNVILTRDENFEADGCIIFHTKDELLKWSKEQQKEIFITGGAEIYRLFMDVVDRLYVTKILHTFEGDTYFPEVNWDNWSLISSKPGVKDEKNPYDYEFRIYERK